MSTREDLDRFMTDESRALVDRFMAESADEDDDVDFGEVVRQNLADHEAALTGAHPENESNSIEAAYQLVTEQHLCVPPSLVRDMVPIEAMRMLRIGTTWDCPECGLRYTVARIAHGGTDWISTGPAATL